MGRGAQVAEGVERGGGGEHGRVGRGEEAEGLEHGVDIRFCYVPNC